MEFRIFATIAVLFMLSGQAYAKTGTWRGMIFESHNDLNDFTLVDGTKAEGDVVIPQRIPMEVDGVVIDGCVVDIIGENAFKGNDKITSILLNTYTAVIDDGAFVDCPNLKEINIRAKNAPEVHGTPFGREVLDKCTLKYPYEATNYDDRTGWRDFANRSKRNPEIEHNGAWFTLYKGEFDQWDGGATLTDASNVADESWTIPQAVYSDEYAGVFPIELTGIEDYAFYNNTKINKLDMDLLQLSKKQATIGTYTFAECRALQSVYLHQITAIGESAFRNCANLGYLKMDFWQPQLTELPAYCFDGCSSLVFDYLEHFRTVGDYALRGTAYYQLEIPVGTSFGTGVFLDCEYIKKVVCKDPDPNPCEGKLFSDEVYAAVPLTVHYSSFDKYRASQPNWGNFVTLETDDDAVSQLEFRINDDGKSASVIRIAQYTSTESTIYIPPYVTLRNSDLEYATYPVTTIDPQAFSGLKGIKAIYLPETLTELSPRALNYVPELAELYIDGPVTVIPLDFCYQDNMLSKVVLPSTVKEIGDHAFVSARLDDFKYPASLEKIGESAFYATTHLTDGNLPSGLKEIGASAFGKCSGLQYLKIPASLTVVGENAFAEMTALTDVEFTEGCTKVTAGAFEGNSGLKNAVMPTTLTEIQDRAFKGTGLQSLTLYCSQIPKGYANSLAVNDPSKLTVYVPEPMLKAYRNDEYWKQFNLAKTSGEGATADGVVYRANASRTEVALVDGGSVKGHFDIPSEVEIVVDDVKGKYKVTSVGVKAFEGNTALTSVSIPETVTDLNSGCFMGCEALESVKLPLSLYVMGADVFNGCRSLPEITIPAEVHVVGDNTFSGCTALKKVTLDGYFTVPVTDHEVFDAATLSTATLEISENALEISKKMNFVWAHFTNTVIRPVDLTMDGVRYEISSDESHATIVSAEGASGELTLPERVRFDINNREQYFPVTSIADNAFSGNVDITEVVIPESITYLGESAFSGCASLESVTVGNSIERIERGTFSGCTGLVEVKLPAELKYLGVQAFFNCRALEHIDIPKSVSIISIGAFAGCESLADIQLPIALKEVPAMCFSGCSSLKVANVPIQVQTIHKRAFMDCASLTEVNIPASMKLIDSKAFAVCDAIESVYCKGIEPSKLESDGFDSEVYSNARLYVPIGGSLQIYAQTPGWKNFFSIFEHSESGIDTPAVDADDIDSWELYNLQGVKVTGNVTPGVYIRYNGSKAVKVFIKE